MPAYDVQDLIQSWPVHLFVRNHCNIQRYSQHNRTAEPTLI